MPLEDVQLEELQDWLGVVQSKEATERLMAAITAKQGFSESEIAELYGLPADTVEEWFAEFDTQPVDEVIEEVERFNLPGRSVKPEVNQPGISRVTFLDYEVVTDHGWSLEDEDLFEKASDADLTPEEYGRVAVERGESILEAVERRGFEWPYACRGGACSNCAVMLLDGEIAMPGQQILPESAIDRGARLTCVGVPASEEVSVVYNVKHLDFLDELRLPPSRFVRT